MAKKKVSDQLVESNKDTQDLSTQKEDVEVMTEEIGNLKLLNSKLVKKAFERKKEVESLVETKSALEEKLERLSFEKVSFAKELNRATDDEIRSEMEMSLVCGFIERQMEGLSVNFQSMCKEVGSKEGEIDLLKKQVDELREGLENGKNMVNIVCSDRDLLKHELGLRGEELLCLKGKVSEFEKKDKQNQEEIAKLMIQCEDLRKKEIEEVKKVKDSAEHVLSLKLQEIEKLHLTVEEWKGEKMLIENEKNKYRTRVEEMEREMAELHEVVSRSKKEEDASRFKLIALETLQRENLEKMKVMEQLISDLKKANTDNVKEIEQLKAENESAMKKHELLTIERNEQHGKLLNERKSMEKEVRGLNEAVLTSKSMEDALRKKISALEEKYSQMVVKLEINESSFSKLERKSFENMQEIELPRTDKESLLKKYEHVLLELKKKEEEVGKLLLDKISAEEERDTLVSMENTITSLKQEISDLKGKAESTSMMSQKALFMLREIASSVCEPINETFVSEMEPYEKELEAIKQAFEQKQVVVDEMKLQVEALQNSVDDANRKKGFLTILSSVTTVFAAIFLACGNRIR